MSGIIIRLESITIENFKNVIKGQLGFANNRKAFRTSFLGLSGQNGSGKTAMNLMVSKKLTAASSRSFIFSKELLTELRNQSKKKSNEEYQRNVSCVDKRIEKRKKLEELLRMCCYDILNYRQHLRFYLF